MCCALDLNKGIYPFREDFQDETTRVNWEDEEVTHIVVYNDYNDHEKEHKYFHLRG